MVGNMFRQVLMDKEAQKVYDTLYEIEEVKELQYIDLTTQTYLSAYSVTESLIKNIDDIETVIQCPPSPPVVIEVITKEVITDIISYIKEKAKQDKIIAVFDEYERGYVILK